MDNTIHVKILTHYGRVTIRPDCETSRRFCELLGQVTLTEDNVKKIKELGYEIKQREVRL